MTNSKIFFGKHKTTLLYGVCLALLLFLLKWLELRFIIIDYAFEIYVGAIAIIFTSLGIWLALNLSKPQQKTIIIEKKILVKSTEDFVRNEKALLKLGLSGREMEVLQLMADGLSNNEIAARLFLSPNTIKTHSSRLFEKLDAKRRTQAVEKARQLMLIP